MTGAAGRPAWLTGVGSAVAYSARSVATGSTRAARMAGMSAARQPTATSAKATAANVAVSVGAVSNRKLSMTRVASAAPPRAEQGAGGDGDRRVAHHSGHDLTRARSEGHPHSDLGGAAFHRVRRHPEDAHER